MKNMYVEAFLHSFQSRMWDIPTLHLITAINSFHCPMLEKKETRTATLLLTLQVKKEENSVFNCTIIKRETHLLCFTQLSLKTFAKQHFCHVM